MSPPSYRDLGKLCRDLLDRNYLDGPWRIRCRTGTNKGIQFSTFGQTLYNSADKIFGSIESRYKIQEYNTWLSGRWHTDDSYFGEVFMRDYLGKGLMMALQMRYFPNNDNDVNGIFLIGYGQEKFKLDANTGAFGGNKMINMSAVVAHERFLAGYQTQMDTNAEIQYNNYALGYMANDWIWHLAINNGAKDYLSSLYAQIGENVDAGVELTFSRRDDDVSTKGFRIGMRYRPDSESIIRAKINQDSVLGLGYQRRIYEGVSVILSTLLECNDARNGDHKIGAGLEFEAGVPPLLEDVQQMRGQPEQQS